MRDKHLISLEILAALEPATNSLEGCCSIPPGFGRDLPAKVPTHRQLKPEPNAFQFASQDLRPAAASRQPRRTADCRRTPTKDPTSGAKSVQTVSGW